MNLQQWLKVNYDIKDENELLSYCVDPDAKTLIKQECLSHLFVISIQLILVHPLPQKSPIKLVYYLPNKLPILTLLLAQMKWR